MAIVGKRKFVWERGNLYAWVWVGNLKQRHYLEELSVDSSIMK